MARPQWREPHGSLPLSYGLGTLKPESRVARELAARHDKPPTR